MPSFLAGGGEMGALTRALDWTATDIGPPATWPQSLKTAVSICLGSRHPIVVWWGKSAWTQFYNDAYISFLGSNKHPRFLGKSGRQCWSEIWPVIGPMLESVYATGEATWSEDLLLVMQRHLPREETYFTFSYSPIRDDTGAIGGIFCACNEMTDRVVGERRLKTLRDLSGMAVEGRAEGACESAARTLSENPHDVPFSLIYLLDEDGRCARLAATTGVLPGSAAAPRTIDMNSNGDGHWQLRQVYDAGVPQLVSHIPEAFGALPGGPWPEPSISALVVPISAPGRATPTGFLVSGLSPRRIIDANYRSFLGLVAGHVGGSIANARAYEQERRRAEALAEIDRAKTAFFSNISHEFRTPLTLMLGPIEEMLNSESSPHRSEMLGLAHRSALRLLRLVNTLLDFSRIEAGRVQASYEPTELAMVTRDLASEFRAATEKAGLDFQIHCPTLAEPVWVDRDMWEKIVLNLISNAFKFTLAGKIEVRVSVQNGNAILEVADTGIGIAAEALPRIFDRFHRVEGARGRTHEGTGIGLALVQELVKLHGGTVAAQSTPGIGSKFVVGMPLGSAHLPADRLRAERTLASTALGARPFVEEALRWLPNAQQPGLPVETEIPPELPLGDDLAQRATILLVDDNADMRDYISRLLSPRYIVHSAADGVEALVSLRERPADLVLSDVMMPRLDGFGLVRKIRSDPVLAHMPIVLLSARAGEDSSVEGLDAGADDYLTKPFSTRELNARIAANLNLSKLRRGFEEQIAADLRAMTILRDLGSDCARPGASRDSVIEKALDAALILAGADKGNVQLLDADSAELTIAAQRGFETPFLKFFEYVRADATACAAAMESRARAVVDDVLTSAIFVGHSSQKAMLDAGVRAVISTPLLSSSGELVGMVSTHFSEAHRPGDRELHLLDLLARQLADFLERKRAEKAEAMLVRELHHRSNNLLSVVQVLAHQSLSDDRSIPQARKLFQSRLHALARVNQDLLKSDWSGISLRNLVHGQTEPFGNRITVDGEDLLLRPNYAQNLSLVLHELATNAAKYGALSNGLGKVQVSWVAARDGNNLILKFQWQESGGPPVNVPTRRGFGTSLFRAAFPNGRIHYVPDGLRCEIELALGTDELERIWARRNGGAYSFDRVSSLEQP